MAMFLYKLFLYNVLAIGNIVISRKETGTFVSSSLGSSQDLGVAQVHVLWGSSLIRHSINTSGNINRNLSQIVYVRSNTIALGHDVETCACARLMFA